MKIFFPTTLLHTCSNSKAYCKHKFGSVLVYVSLASCRTPTKLLRVCARLPHVISININRTPQDVRKDRDECSPLIAEQNTRVKRRA